MKNRFLVSARPLARSLSLSLPLLLLPFLISSRAFAGPIRVPLEEESAAIQAAPAYDVVEAKTYIDDMPEIRELIDYVREEDGLTVFGSASPSPAAVERLDQEIQNLLEGNHKVSLLMVDLKTRSGVAFQPSIPMCTQSTVKAVYVGSLLDSVPQALEENGQYMHDAIVYSDNGAYSALRRIYGSEPIRKWCTETGVSESFAEPDYPKDKTAKDMLKLWTRLYCLLNDGTDTTGFGRYYADSESSATKAVLDGICPVQTKAGWESGQSEDGYYNPSFIPSGRLTDGDPSNNECAINDTGIVYTKTGPYLFVIYTNHPYGVFLDTKSPNPLKDLATALFETQQSLSDPAEF